MFFFLKSAVYVKCFLPSVTLAAKITHTQTQYTQVCEVTKTIDLWTSVVLNTAEATSAKINALSFEDGDLSLFLRLHREVPGVLIFSLRFFFL